MGAYGQTLEEFARRHREKLTGIYQDYLTDDRHPLMSQPESVLVFERLTADRFALKSGWPDGLPLSFLTAMATIWGVPVDTDDDE